MFVIEIFVLYKTTHIQMNAEFAFSIVKMFLVDIFTRMNNGTKWEYEPNYPPVGYNPQNRAFQEICDQDFDGDTDRFLDEFFREKMTNYDSIMWFSDWVFYHGYFHQFTDELNDLNFVCQVFHNYMTTCTVDEMKHLLGLDFIMK